MQASELELVATQELVDELLRRQTFLGVVIHSREEYKNDWQGERVFSVHHNANLNPEQLQRLLDTIADHLDTASD